MRTRNFENCCLNREQLVFYQLSVMGIAVLPSLHIFIYRSVKYNTCIETQQNANIYILFLCLSVFYFPPLSFRFLSVCPMLFIEEKKTRSINKSSHLDLVAMRVYMYVKCVHSNTHWIKILCPKNFDIWSIKKMKNWKEKEIFWTLLVSEASCESIPIE